MPRKSINMNLSTFLKLLTLNTGEKLRDVQKYKEAGGYDFYQALRAAHLKFGPTPDVSLGIDFISARASANAKKVNEDLYRASHEWILKQKGEFFSPSRALFRSPRNVFSVTVNPEIGLRTKSVDTAYAIYPRQHVRINRDQAGAALLLMSEAYGDTSNMQFGVLDVTADKAFRTPTNMSKAILDAEVRFLEIEFLKLRTL